MAIIKYFSKSKGWRFKPAVQVPNSTKFMRSHTWGKKLDAQREERELIRQKEMGNALNLFAPLPFNESADEWMKFQKMKGSSASHLERISVDMKNYFKPCFGFKDIKQIKPSDIQAFVNEAKKQLAPYTLNRMLKTLKSFFNWLIEEDRLLRNPIKKKHLLPPNRTNLRPVWTKEEAEQFMNFLDQKYKDNKRWIYIFFKISMNCGMRFGEVLALEKADFDFDNNRIRISKSFCSYSNKIKLPKNNKVRFAPLPSSLAADVKDYCVQSQVFGYLFKDNNTGIYHSYDKIRSRYLKDIKETGLPYTNIHNLRRFFITQYVENGGHEAQLRKIVGHASQSMTDLYLVQPEDMGKIAQIVNI